MKSSTHEQRVADDHGLVHILDDSQNDGFAWCGKPPTLLEILDGRFVETKDVATCLTCIVKAARYRGIP